MDRGRVVVFGANGFVGANLVRFLMDHGFKVTAVVRNSASAWRLNSFPHKVRLWEGSVSIRQSVVSALKDIEPVGVINTAVYGGYPFQKESEGIYKTNFEGCRNVTEASFEAGVEWCINTGSSSEYGFKDSPMKEADILEPADDYAVSKAAASLYCSSFARRSNFRLFNLRLFSVYGPFEEPTRLIPHLLLSLIRGKVPQLSSPKPLRDYVYAGDACEAYLRVIENYSNLKPGDTFNVGSGRSTSVGDVVETISRIISRRFEVRWESNPGRASDVAKEWVADTEKSRRVLGWEAKVDLEMGLRLSNEWFNNNLKLYRES